MTLAKLTFIALAMALLSTTLIGQKPDGGDPELARKIARFAPTTLTADTSKLTPKDKQALDKIVAAAKLLDPLFLRQVWSGNDALEKKLQVDNSRSFPTARLTKNFSRPRQRCCVKRLRSRRTQLLKTF